MDSMLTPWGMSADSWSTTEVRSITHTHLWTIRGFSQCDCRYLETTAKIRDISAQPQANVPTSSGGLPDLPVITFRIRLHPQGNKESNKDFTFFQCFLNNQSTSSSTNTPYKTKFKFTVFNQKGEETPTTVYSGTQQLHGYFEYIRRDVLISHVQPADELQLSLSITVTFDTITKVTHNINSTAIQPVKPKEITKDLENLYRSGKHTDFTILIDGHELKAHKTILAARSPVFAAMLEPHTEEYQKGKVVLKDMDYDVMQELLHYMYTGKTQNISGNALEILTAADRYELPGLKSLAEQELRSALTVESVCKYLALADMYSANDLRKESIRFIVFNAASVVKTEGFAELSASNTPIVAEMFQAVASDKSAWSSAYYSASKGESSSDPPTKRARMADS